MSEIPSRAERMFGSFRKNGAERLVNSFGEDLN